MSVAISCGRKGNRTDSMLSGGSVSHQIASVHSAPLVKEGELMG